MGGKKLRKCFHDYRLWFEGKSGLGICGRCGEFIFVKKPSRPKVLWLYVNSFFRKNCLACSVEDANRCRKDTLLYHLLGDKQVAPARENVQIVSGEVEEQRVKNIVKGNVKPILETMISERVSLKHNHNYKCYLRRWVLKW